MPDKKPTPSATIAPDAPADYSEAPLLKKLGIRQGMTIRLLDAPSHYWSLLGSTPAELGLTLLAERSGEPAELTHVFASSPDALEEGLDRARERMTEDGSIWVSWPKKASLLASEIGRDEVMAAGKRAGLVDNKVCAVDDDWSGLRFVIPVADRG